MKRNSRGTQISKAFFVLTLAFTISLFSSCAKRVKFKPSSSVPSAQGYVKITKDADQSRSISIKVSNISSPQKLNPSKEVYIVWIETRANGVKKLGQLEGFLSYGSNRPAGTFKAITPFKPTKIFITAEDTGSSAGPGNQILLQTRNFD